VIFNPKGEIIQTIESPISSLTDDPALDVSVMVDGKGRIYLIYQSTVYLYDSDGRYINKFVAYADGQDQGMYVNSNICVDGQGLIYLADNSQVALFDENGRLSEHFATDSAVYGMVLDDQGNLWTTSGEQITEFVKSGR
jgi:sugar lactone lactonase YvrE